MPSKQVIIHGMSVTLYWHKRGWSMDRAEEDNERLDAVYKWYVSSWHNKAHTSDPMDVKLIGIDNERRFGCH